ncbi:protein Dss4p [[Candida] railenensis]|uniref:Protein Dss4p n=1 Tax=[Candida] railenensis TaxID=45579 RepID=A0A9P0QS52_9ASCO|nr:protein Dss4p [[Candida] railenensis]
MSYTSYTDLKSVEESTIVRCPFKNCHARIIQVGTLPKVNVENSPDMTKLSEDDNMKQTETYFYQIDDVWEFDNIGVSRPAAELKEPIITSDTNEKVDIAVERLLICSECDKGPIGFAGIPKGSENHHQNLKYFLSCASVLYEVK